MQICRGFTDTQWRKLRKRLKQDGSPSNDDAAWRCAIEVFERRIRERFLSCVEALQTNDSKLDVEVPSDAPADCSTLPTGAEKDAVVPGFAIMALCCLLIETLQSFREAHESPPPAADHAPTRMGLAFAHNQPRQTRSETSYNFRRFGASSTTKRSPQVLYAAFETESFTTQKLGAGSSGVRNRRIAYLRPTDAAMR